MLRTCERCGTPYESVCTTAKFCAPCRKEVIRQRDHAKHQRKKQELIALRSMEERKDETITSDIVPGSKAQCFGCPLMGWDCRESIRPPCHKQWTYNKTLLEYAKEDVYA